MSINQMTTAQLEESIKGIRADLVKAEADLVNAQAEGDALGVFLNTETVKNLRGKLDRLEAEMRRYRADMGMERVGSIGAKADWEGWVY